MKRFNAWQVYILFISIMSSFFITGCGHRSNSTAPRVTAVVPLNNAVGVAVNTGIAVAFSEAMDTSTITTTTFTLMEGTIAVSGAVASSDVNAVFTPASDLASNTTYTATITTGVKDVDGDALASNYVWSFTTGSTVDTTTPTVILKSPADTSTGVCINKTINATFSETMNPLTINTANFTVADITGTVTYDLIDNIAIFTPASNLAANTTYTATITTGAKNLADNALANNDAWSFTTGTSNCTTPVALGAAAPFGIMATSAITSTGASIINGDVSLNPGTSMTGFPPAVVNGAIHINDTASAQARDDLLVAYNTAKDLAPGTTVSGGADLGALYPLGIPPDTYTSGSTMLVSTPLTLDAGGNADAIWIFQIGSSLTTGASVSLTNGAQAKNVFWVPTSDATIGVGTIFYGTIVAGRDVTCVTGTTINGRILAGAITAGTIALQACTINVPAQ